MESVPAESGVGGLARGFFRQPTRLQFVATAVAFSEYNDTITNGKGVRLDYLVQTVLRYYFCPEQTECNDCWSSVGED